VIHYVRQNDLDTLKWDACINGDPSALPYALHWYLDLTAKEWDALVVNDYEAVFPLPFSKKLGIAYLYRPYGTQQLGLFGKTANAEMLAEVIQAIPKKFLWVDYYLNEGNVPSPLNGCSFQEQTNQVLDLDRTYKAVYEGYNKRTKRNIKKARAKGFRIFEYDSPEVLLDLFKQNKGSRLNGWNNWHYARMRQLMYVLIHKRRGFIWTLHDEHNTACAGIFILQYRHRLVSLFTAVNDYGKEHGAMSHLLDELFILYSEKGFLYDFEGSNISGLAEFNAGFGAESRSYFRLVRSGIPFLKSLRL
jgi:hypothetical protein